MMIRGFFFAIFVFFALYATAFALSALELLLGF